MKKLLAAFAATAALAFATPAAQAAQSTDVYVSHGQQAKISTVAWHRHYRRHHHRRHYR
jgi:Spy/CpxP family protein refolding chaperone